MECPISLKLRATVTLRLFGVTTRKCSECPVHANKSATLPRLPAHLTDVEAAYYMVGADRNDADPMIPGNLQATRLGVGMGRFRRRPRLATGKIIATLTG
jgi:hypothetical protein